MDPPANQGPQTSLGPLGRYLATRLVRHNTIAGKLRLVLANQGRLIARHRITRHVVVTSGDGMPIDTWLIRFSDRPAALGSVILLHGLWDSKVFMLPLARQVAGLGYDAVLCDLRCHGRSGGRFTTYGGLEKGDAKCVMDFLESEGLIAGPRHVIGFSVGGGVAVQYAAIDPQVAAVMALAPVASAELIMRRMLRVMWPGK